MSRSAFTHALLVLIVGLASLILVAGSALPSVEKREMIVKRDVWAPRITDPKEGSVWRAGEVVKVTWDTKNPPKHITNSNGVLSLRTTNGFVQGPGGLGEPLASNFSLFDGHVKVTVPKVPGRDDYQVVLFGDSGNESPFFTIAGSMLAPFVPM